MKFFAAVLALAGLAQSFKAPLPVDVLRAHPHLMLDQHYPDDRIINGVPVAAGEIKYQIALIRSGSFICGGSLVDPNYVLTAAHCVDRNENNPRIFKIRYGTINRNDATNEITVAQIFKHEQYSSSTIDYDVAVMKLDKPFSPSDNAQMITLSPDLPTASDSLVLSGWGRAKDGSLPINLSKAENLKFVSTADCQAAWGTVNSITKRMLCVIDGQQSACNGDSGGPLVRGGIQVGVVSWGVNGCATGKYPNVFASVPELKNWIESKMV